MKSKEYLQFSQIIFQPPRDFFLSISSLLNLTSKDNKIKYLTKARIDFWWTLAFGLSFGLFFAYKLPGLRAEDEVGGQDG